MSDSRTLDSFEQLREAFDRGEAIYAVHPHPIWGEQPRVVGIRGAKIVVRHMAGSYSLNFNDHNISWTIGGDAMD